MRPVLKPTHLFVFQLAALVVVGCGGDVPPPPSDDRASTVVIDAAEGRVAGFDLTRSATVLPDGRLAILQPDCVVILDFVRSRSDTIRRNGEGPGEFRRPVAMGLGSGGDLTVIDGGSRVVSVPVDGRIGTTIRNDSVLPNVYWARPDTFGTLFLAEYRRGAEKSPESTIDTLLMSRLQPTGAWDTVGSFTAATFQPVPASNGTMSLAFMFAPVDAWGVTAAGDVWQLEGTTFQPRWWDRATETWREGKAGSWTPVPVVAEDREPLPHNPRYPQLDSVLRPATEFKPPFLEAVAAPDGEIWARLSQPRGALAERVAVFPRDGRVSDVVFEFPRGRHLVGLGSEFVYLAVEETDGTWSVERYARPVEDR